MTFDLRLTRGQCDEVLNHLFPGDGQEHGAVFACGLAEGSSGPRLLVRRVFIADDGSDFVASRRAHRALSAEFVATTSDYCRQEGLVWLSVHNHGPGDAVDFSRYDRQSHERLYPSLAHYTGRPVGALVFADQAVAGELRIDGARRDLRRATVVGNRIEHLFPRPNQSEARADPAHHRQALLFGEAGQALLREMKVAVVGAGGAGSIIAMQLARLGIGELIVIDPDRLAVSNLSRIPGARRSEALAYLEQLPWSWPHRVARRFARPKVRVIGREVKRANPKGRYRGIFGDATSKQVVQEITDADFIFCATDTMMSRMLVNAIAFQYLVPAIQVGAKVPIDSGGQVGIIHVSVRPVTVDTGCLDCAGVISQRQLHEESLALSERSRHRYVDDPSVTEPSVISLNAEAAGRAVTDFLFMVCALHREGVALEHQMYEPRERVLANASFNRDPGCSYCSETEQSRFALGDGRALPTR